MDKEIVIIMLASFIGVLVTVIYVLLTTEEEQKKG